LSVSLSGSRGEKMLKRVPQFAKLTRPRLHNAVARERLFALLDEAREHKPAICAVGPPGAGKTTLVASWLDARGIKDARLMQVGLSAASLRLSVPCP
jgi:ATP/maltotriose-dependent transcriptional regulator MalT